MVQLRTGRPVQASGRAMGCDALVAVLGDPDLARAGLERLAELERRWTRFDPNSELRRMNAAAGSETIVSADLYTLVTFALAAHELTAGRYDPTVGRAVRALGYRTSFEDITTTVALEPPLPAPGVTSIRLDPRMGSVSLPAGIELDPGGIGKGLAADLVAAELTAAGADGVLVDVGGDVRVVGTGPDDGLWRIAVDHGDGCLGHLSLSDGGLATSSTRRRRWETDQGARHHLVDPRTGTNPTSPAHSATVVAGTAWWAEAAAKAVLIDPAAVPRLDGIDVVWTDADGHHHVTDGMAASLERSR